MTASASASADVARRGEGLLLERPWCGGGRPLATSPRHMTAACVSGGGWSEIRLVT